MPKKSTMKPFETGDIFLGCTYLNNPNDDHQGEGRILQFDREWRPKGTLYTEGTRYLIIGCKMGPDGTLWAFDCHDHITVRVDPEGAQLPNWESGRSFGSVNWDLKGNLIFGEYFVGTEIWQGTSAKMLENGTLGDGNIYQYTAELELQQVFEVENAPEFSKFKGVTHVTIHPSGEFITYTTETGRRLMRYDIQHDEQMEDLDGYPDADPANREDRRWFIAPTYLADGRLICTVADGLQIYSATGELKQRLPLPGYGWAQVIPDVDERYVLAANVWTGTAARIDIENNSIEQIIDVGFTAPFRSLAGVAVCR